MLTRAGRIVAAAGWFAGLVTLAAQGADQPQSTATVVEAGVHESGAAPEVVGSLGELRRWDIQAASPARRVRLQGVVAFVHPTQRTFFVCDATGGVMISVPGAGLALPAVGGAVVVTARLESGTESPSVLAEVIDVRGQGRLPAARETNFERAMSGADDARWVEIEGRLRQTEVVDNWVRLTLDTPDGTFTASIPTSEPVPFQVGEALRVRGVCSRWREAATQRVGGFFLYTPSLADVQVIDRAPEGDAVLRQVGEVQRLRADEAGAGRRVQLRGVVTFAHPDQRIFYLNDATGGVLVWLPDPAVALPPVGVSLEVRGQTSAGMFTANVRCDEYRAGLPQPLPAPRVISLEQALAGSENGQWVELRGHLRQVDAVAGWLRLRLSAAAGEFTVSIPEATPRELEVGSLVAVRGVGQTWLREDQRIGGFYLYAPALDQIAVIEPPPEDPFAVPEEAISNLPLYRTQTLQQQQVLIRGSVVHQVPGHHVVVENASGAVRAQGRGDVPLTPGDRIEVAGIPGRVGNRSVLRDAVYRRIGPGPAPVAVPLQTPEGLTLDPALENRLVSVAGTVVNTSWRPENTRLLVQTGHGVVEIMYGEPMPERGAAEWQAGSKVLATGLYEIAYDDEDRPAKFSVQLRTPDDLVIRERPSWWSMERALTGLMVVGGGLLLGLGWVAVLRRQVRRQTEMIRRQWEQKAMLQARQREIVAHASDVIFTTDGDGRFTSFNPAGERVTGYTEAEALRLGLLDLIAVQDAAVGTALLALTRAAEGGPAQHYEMRLRTRDGRLVWVETSARQIVEAGRPAGLLGIARDVTERKHAEAEKAKLLDLNRQLQRSESLGRMAGAVAHIFNNQLQAVMLGLEAALGDESREGTSSSGSLAIAMKSARKASDVSKLMLTYLGQAVLTRESLDLSEVCEQVAARLTTTAGPGRALERRLPLPGPRIVADAEQIQQALTNLVINGWEAGDGGRGVVRMSVSTVATADIPAGERFPIGVQVADGPHACIEIMDTGAGIRSEEIEKIFDPFYSSKFAGRGLGLPAVLGIVRAHAGVVIVTSVVGRGSIFRLLFPVADGDG